MVSLESLNKEVVASKYAKFDSLDEYREFFRGFQDAGTNYVSMFVPQSDPKRSATLTKVLITNPDTDFRLLNDVLDGDDFKNAEWTIEPIRLTEERKRNTDRLTYRVRLRKHLIPEYRKYMNEGSYFPLLVFDTDRNFWISGRHRSEAAEKDYNAVFAMVFRGLSEKQVLLIADATNRWHAEHWDDDELATLAYGYTKMFGWSEKRALTYVGLDPVEHLPALFGAQLWRKYPKVIESHHAGEEGNKGGGRPRSLKFLGTCVLPFGAAAGRFTTTTKSARQAVEDLSEDDWLFILNDPLQTIRKVTSSYRGGERYSYLREEDKRSIWRLKGTTPKERFRHFQSLVALNQDQSSLKKAGITESSDGLKFLAFVNHFASLSDGKLASVKRGMSAFQKTQTRELLARLERIFG